MAEINFREQNSENFSLSALLRLEIYFVGASNRGFPSDAPYTIYISMMFDVCSSINTSVTDSPGQSISASLPKVSDS
ncbi:hypothetical protein TDB9533_00006 [Thalassocella blandensis]|nr:hypothetical protein TDB9533_00006 [Thalassocella blandensis]